MERINTRNELIDMLKNIVALEIKAKEDYEEDMKLFNDEQILSTLKKIRDDEIRHIDMLEKLIKFLTKE